MIKFTKGSGDCGATLNGEYVTYHRDEAGNVFVYVDEVPEFVFLMLHEDGYPEYAGLVKDGVLYVGPPRNEPKPTPCAPSASTSVEDNAPTAEPGTDRRRRRVRNAE